MPALLEARPTRSTSYEDDDFVVFLNVPIFKEHTSRDGVRYGKGDLEQICARCNERIEDTGDFPTVVIGHRNTNDEGEIISSDDEHDEPEVVGFAGPFRMGMFGKLKPRATIFGNLRIFKADAERVKKYPRLSVEYWCSQKNPYGGFFDPISLLGAQTPELDLGIRYSKNSEGQRVICYSKATRFQAASPGGSNTYIPGGIERKKNYEKEPAEMSQNSLSPEAIQQIVEAMKPVVAAAVSEQVAQLQPAGGVVQNEADPTDPAVDVTADPMADPLADPLADPANPDDLAADPVADLDADPMADPSVDPSADLAPDADDKLTVDHYEKMCSYADSDDEEGGREYFSNLDDDGKASVTSKFDSETDENLKDKLRKYMTQTEPDMAAVKYQRERDEISKKYQKLVADHRDLKVKHDKLAAEKEIVEKEKRKAIRYQKLAEIQATGVVMEIEEELTDLVDVTDDQFEKHCNRMVTKYQRVPGGTLHVPESPRITGDRAENKSEQYSKKARERCEKSAAKGQYIPYAEALQQVMAEENNQKQPAA